MNHAPSNSPPDKPRPEEERELDLLISRMIDGEVSEADRRLIQQNIGGFYSAADRTASRVGFLRCMATFEWRCGGALPWGTHHYWRQAADEADPLDGLRWRIDRMAESLGWSAGDVDAFLASDHMTSGRYGSVREAPRYWLSRLLDALKAIHARATAQEAHP